MSEYVVHLTKKEPFGKILREEVLKPGDKLVGAATNLQEVANSQHAVCLSEIPLDRLDRLVARHGEFGVGFRKSFIRMQAGAPVWYLPRGTPPAEHFKELVRTAMQGHIEPDALIWRLTPFIDNPGMGDGWRYEFEWEREWRIVGDLAFNPLTDIEFFIAPQRAHLAICNGWGEAEDLMPPLIDLTWDLPRLQGSLAEHGLSEDAPTKS